LSGVPASAAPSILNKSYIITAEVGIPAGGAEGMIVTEGGRFGGYGLFLSKGVAGIRGGKPVFLYNLLNLKRTIWSGPALNAGKHTIVFDFKSDGPGLGKCGTGILSVDGKEVARNSMGHTTPITFPEDESFDIGLDEGDCCRQINLVDVDQRLADRAVRSFLCSGLERSANERITSMKRLSLLVGIVGALTITAASAQSVDLTGTYKCIQMCRGDALAYVTQNGSEFNLLTEAGVPSRAWPDWYSPANRIWIDTYNISAVYSSDGMLIQFDNGTIWQRYVPPPPPLRRRG
jgi:hypothetical protein